MLLSAGAAPAGDARGPDLQVQARSIAEAFPDDGFCFFVPPRPLEGLFMPAPDKAVALARDHRLAQALEPALRAAASYPFITLAPSYPFDAARHRVHDPLLVRILVRNLWLYADYWEAARAVVVDGELAALPRQGLEPLRTACAPVVMLFVFADEEGGVGAAGYISLLTGRSLAAFPDSE